jgi:hypothetical protein
MNHSFRLSALRCHYTTACVLGAVRDCLGGLLGDVRAFLAKFGDCRYSLALRHLIF